MLNKIVAHIQEIYRFKEMFTSLVGKEIQARYKGSLLGFFWTLLNPLLMMVIYSLVFSQFMRLNIPNYSLFLFVGLLPWSWFATSITNATSAIVGNAGLIRKVYFPTEILPLVNVTANLINYLLSLPVLLGFMLFFRVPITWTILQLPILIAIQFLFTLGIALIFATVNTYFRDIEQLLSSLLLAWFYLTPVFYQETMIPIEFRKWFLLNPMVSLMAGYHRIFMDGKWLHLKDLMPTMAIGIVLFAIGYALFYSQRYNFAEVV